MRRRWLLLAAMLPFALPARAQVPSLVAGENVYGEAARQIAGPGWAVTSILSNPNQDPHLFEASPSVARALSAARIVVSNGAGYDPWMAKLLRGLAPPGAREPSWWRDLLHRRPGSNPHLWYDPACMPAYAARARRRSSPRPTRRTGRSTRHGIAEFLATLQPLQARIAALAAKFRGVPVTATEPVFGPMASALGLVDAQRAVPARRDERHRTLAPPTLRRSKPICGSTASAC